MVSENYRRCQSALKAPVHTVNGVGPKVQEKLKRLGIETIEDLLYTLPIRYEDRRKLYPLSRLPSQGRIVVGGQVLSAGQVPLNRSRRKLFEVLISDGTGTLSLKWFHFRYPWMKKRFVPGQWLLAIGDIKRFGGRVEMSHPETEPLKDKPDPDALPTDERLGLGRIVPVYPLTEGLSQSQAQKIWTNAINQYLSSIYNAVPQRILEENGLLPSPQCLATLHQPDTTIDPSQLEQPQSLWRRSLVFDEFFFLQLGLALRRKGVIEEEGRSFTLEHKYTRPLSHLLPYRLTQAQRRVLGEIKQDMLAPHPMNRLVQGDVGSGKTIVALMAGLIAIENGAQVALVAPTEILAEQHYFQFQTWLTQLNLKAVLLTGSMTAANRRQVLQQIADGSAHFIIGTHAILQESVEFHNLGLGIIDEQHRFGVRQRGALKSKGLKPDMLVMTATPIPRTLSMTLYGDLAVSIIDELPPGRQTITTRLIFDSQREQAYAQVRQQLQKGRQAYIVYPLVEESEKSDLKAATEAMEVLQKGALAEFTLGLLHGKMKALEKEEVMRRFNTGEIQALISTTVIEVGVDVPNATVMMIEHAERFGLAQLHQLRGRVGRGDHASQCLLITEGALSEDSQKRLEMMVQSQDGFRLAEADLQIRGPGEILGTRQAGMPDLRVGNLLTDGRTLQAARKAAFHLVNTKDIVHKESCSDLRQTLKDRWGSRLEIATIG